MKNLIVHAGLLAIVLSVGIALSSPGVPYSSDEGAVIIQARQIERTGRWTEANPLPGIDPRGEALTVPNSDSGIKGRAPYAKHPLYPIVVALAEEIGGNAAVVSLGIIGSVVAALAAAGIAGFFDNRLKLWALWLAGLGSPLAFDAGIVVAHSLGAAAVGLTVFAALRLLDDDRPRPWGWMAIVAVGAALCVGLRTEGLFLGSALVVAASVAAVTNAGRRRAIGLAIAAATVVGVLVAALAERVAVRNILGPAAPSSTPSIPGLPYGFLHARVNAFVRSWLSPSDGGGLVRLSLTVGFASIAIAALIGRRRSRPDLVAILLSLACAGYLLRFVAGPHDAIPGLIVAFPAGCFALFSARRRDFDSMPSRFVLAVLAVFIIGVLAAQYADGGGAEWGGRYFAISLPAAAPLVVLVVSRRLVEYRDARFKRLLVGGLVAASLLVTSTAWWTLARTHQAAHRWVGAIHLMASELPDSNLGRLVVTTDPLLPQIDWPEYRKYLWLAPPSDHLGMFEARLVAARTSSFVLATLDPVHDLAQTAPYKVIDRRTVSNLTLAVLRLGGT